MTFWEEKLLGQLVGLARAPDGNEHLNVMKRAAQVGRLCFYFRDIFLRMKK